MTQKEKPACASAPDQSPADRWPPLRVPEGGNTVFTTNVIPGCTPGRILGRPGLNVSAAVTGAHIQAPGGHTLEQLRAMVEGGIFRVRPMSNCRAVITGCFWIRTPASAPPRCTVATAGVNYYISPDSHACKFTAISPSRPTNNQRPLFGSGGHHRGNTRNSFFATPRRAIGSSSPSRSCIDRLATRSSTGETRRTGRSHGAAGFLLKRSFFDLWSGASGLEHRDARSPRAPGRHCRHTPLVLPHGRGARLIPLLAPRCLSSNPLERRYPQHCVKPSSQHAPVRPSACRRVVALGGGVGPRLGTGPNKALTRGRQLERYWHSLEVFRESATDLMRRGNGAGPGARFLFRGGACTLGSPFPSRQPPPRHDLTEMLFTRTRARAGTARCLP